MKKLKTLAIIGAGSIHGCDLVTAISKIAEQDMQVIIVNDISEFRRTLAEDLLEKRLLEKSLRYELPKTIQYDRDFKENQHHPFGGITKYGNHNTKGRNK